MPNLLILSKKADQYEALVRAEDLPELETFSSPNAGVEAGIAAQCELVLGEPDLIRSLLPSLAKLRWAQSTWAGVEPLLEAPARRDYMLTNARGVFGPQMSEYVFGYLLAHERRLWKQRGSQLERHWAPAESGTLRGRTIGLLGVGSIGAHLAGTAKHFHMTVRGYTRASETCPDVDTYYHGEELVEFAKGLDYLVCSLPNTSATGRLAEKTLFAVLPSHALFINVGRGGTVDEAALVDALRSKQIAGAVLDVFEVEPLPESSPFWDLPNVFITFHTAAITNPKDVVDLFCENSARYLGGEPLKYVVDFELGY
jgi:phosphoglycerate dehydrogenase-like enzyme